MLFLSLLIGEKDVEDKFKGKEEKTSRFG